MNSDDEVYFDAVEEPEEAESTKQDYFFLNYLSTSSVHTPLTPEYECRRNRIESLKKSARKLDRPSPIPDYPHFDSIEPASVVVNFISISYAAQLCVFRYKPSVIIIIILLSDGVDF